jgi:hypothetical protein
MRTATYSGVNIIQKEQKNIIQSNFDGDFKIKI